MYGVTASLSVIFANVYPYLTQADLGLCFLAIGGGMVIGTWLSGKLINFYYRKTRNDIVRQTRLDSEKNIDPKALEQDPMFPLEKARLRVLPCIMFLYTACVVGYGWALESRVTIAVPLILQTISKSVSRIVLYGLVSYHLLCSWHGSYCYNEHYPDTVDRPGALPGILYHCMCTCPLQITHKFR